MDPLCIAFAKKNVISSILSQGVKFNELAGVWFLSKQTQTLDVFTVA